MVSLEDLDPNDDIILTPTNLGQGYIVPITSPLDYLVESHSTLSEPTPDPPLRESTPTLQYSEDSNAPNEGDPKGIEDDQFWSQGYDESNSEDEDTLIKEPGLKIWSDS
jgi:hypothetical protein